MRRFCALLAAVGLFVGIIGTVPAGAGVTVPVTSDLVVWLKADTITGLGDADFFTTWADSAGTGSGIGDDTSQDATLLDGNPQYFTNRANGMPVVQFGGGGAFSFAGPLGISGQAEFTAFIVGDYNGTGGNHRAFNFGEIDADPGGTSVGLDVSSAGFRFNNGNRLFAESFDDTFRIGTWQMTTTSTYGTAEYWLDGTPGTETGSTNPGNVTNISDEGYYVGRGISTAGNPNDWYTGDMAELLLYKRALTTEEIAAVGAYLELKYGLNTAFAPDAELTSQQTGDWNDDSDPRTWDTTDPAILIPTALSEVVVDEGHTVTIRTAAAAGLAGTLEIIDSGKVVIGADQSLTVTGAVEGSNLELANNAVLNAGGTSEIDSLVASGASGTVNTIGQMTLGSYSDAGGATTLTLKGGGTYTLESGSTVADSAVTVEDSTLKLAGVNPLGAAQTLTLKRGTLSVTSTGVLDNPWGKWDFEGVTPPTVPNVGSDAPAVAGTMEGDTLIAVGQSFNGSDAISFDGFDDDVNYGAVARMDSPGVFTASIWFRRDGETIDATNHNVNNVLLAQADNSTNDNFEIGTEGDNVELYVDTAGTDDFTAAVPGGIANGVWHHVAVSYDQNAVNELKLYFNGSLIQEWDTPDGALLSANGSPMSLGMSRVGTDNWGELWGLMDNVRLFDRALPATEIAGLAAEAGGLPAYVAASMSNVSVVVDGDSTIDAQAATGVSFAGLTLKDGVVTTTGLGGVTFSGGTAIASDATDVGIDPRVETSYGGIDGSATAQPFLFTKAGPADVDVGPGFFSGMTNATIKVEGGTTRLTGADPLAGAKVLNMAGGMVSVSDVLGAAGTGAAPADPAAHWAFDELAGAIEAVDSSPSGGHTGTINGPLVEQPGMIGTAYSFDGVDDSVDVAGYKGIGSNNPRTLSAWVKTTADDAAFLAWGEDVTGEKWNFRVQTSNGQAGAIRVEISTGYIVGDTDIRDNQWHHVAAVLPDGATDATQMRLYVDGRRELVSASNTTPINTDNVNGIDVVIGNDHANRYFSGGMDDVFIYDRALSGAEVVGMYSTRGAAPDMSAVKLTVTADSVLMSDSTTAVAFSDLTLNDGTLTLTGISPISFPSTTVDTTMTTAGLNRQVEATFGPLTMKAGMLGTAGLPITFDSTAIDEAAGAVGFNVETATELNVITGGGAGPLVTITKSGSQELLLDKDNSNLQNATFHVAEGTLKIRGTNPLGGATALTLSGGTFAVADIPGAPGSGTAPADHLVAHWKFDEAPGSGSPTTADETGNYTGAVMGGADFSADAVDGNAMAFDGVDDYVDLPDGMADFTGGITVAGWVKTEAFTDWARVVDLGNGEALDNIILARNGTGANLRFGFHDTATGTENLDGPDVFKLHEWQFIAATCTEGVLDNATAKVYLNGLEVGSNAAHSTPPNVIRTSSFIGKSNWAADALFQGLLDDLYIYNRELTPLELAEMYASRGAATDVSAVKVTVTGDSALLADSTSTVAFHDLTLSAGTLTTEGVVGVSFNSTTVDTPTTAGIDAQVTTAPGPLTMKAGVLGTSGRETLSFDSTTIDAAATAVGFDVTTSPELGVITGGGAGHVVTISKLGAGELVLDQANQDLDDATFEVQEGTLKLVGAAAWGGAGKAVLAGGVLYVEDAGTMPDVPAGAIAHYSFNNSYVPAFDETLHGHDGTLVSEPAFMAGGGKVGAALDFDGLDDGVDLEDPPFLEAANSERTVSMWIQQGPGATGDQMVFDEGGSTNGLGIQTQDGRVQTRIKVGADTRDINDPDALSADNWHHVAVVFGDSTLSLYVDGAPLFAPVDTPFAVLADHTDNPGIGYRNAANPFTTAGFFDGLIDEVYIYEAALDSADITRLFDAGSFVPAPLDLSLKELTVTAGSTLRAASASTAAFGPLKLVDGILTVRGAPLGVTFDGTTLTPAVADAVTGIDTNALIEIGALSADGVTPVTFSKQGPGDIVMNQEGVDLDAVIIDVTAGRLIGLPGSNPFGAATLQIGGVGGELVLAAKETDTSPVAYDNEAVVAADGMITAGPGGVGGEHAAEGMTIQLGSVDRALTLGDATTVRLRSVGNYSLEVLSEVAGLGGIDVTEGSVTLTDGDFGSATASGGTLALAGPIQVGSLDMAGGQVAHNGNGITVTSALTLTQSDLDMTGAVLTTAGADVTVDAGRLLTVANELGGANVNVAGTAHLAGANVTNLNVTGALEATADVQVDTMQVPLGGLVNVGENQVVVRESLFVGGNTYSINPENTFAASGTDLASAADFTLSGGNFTVTGREPAPTDALVGNWKFDETSGLLAVNSATPGDKDGTLTNFDNDPNQWVEGRFDGALDFDGANDRVQITDYNGIGGTDPRTISAWIKTTDNDAGIMGWGRNSSGQKWTFRVQDDSGTAGTIRVEINGGYQVGSTPVWDDEWHHVAAVFPQGATNVNEVLLYVDGQLEANSATNARAVNTDTNSPVKIGVGQGNNTPFDGLIDEVLLYGRDLSAEEIGLLFGGGFGPGAEGLLDLSVSNVLVSADTTITSANKPVVVFGDLTITNPVDPPATTLTLADAFYVFEDVTAEDDATIVGNFAAVGTVSPGGSVGVLNVEGELELVEATYLCEIDSSGADLVRNLHMDDPIILGEGEEGGTLTLLVLESLGAPGCYTDAIIATSGTGVIEGDFAVDQKPAEGDYLDYGVFLDGYEIVDTGNGFNYNVNLFQADVGDSDGDGDVDLDDLSALDDGWDPAADDKIWKDGDFDLDGDVDLDDLSALDDHWNPGGYPVVNCPFGGGEGLGSAAVPEPGTFALLAMGLVALLLWRRYRRPTV